MNHLAHARLAGPDPDVVVGSLLADFWRGAPDPAWRPGVIAGVRLHRHIDAITDAHPAVVSARALFEPGVRRWAGVALDVWFDHCLARDFEQMTGEPLRGFADHVYAVLGTARIVNVPAFELFVARLARHDGLAGYADRGQLDFVFERIAARTSRANPLASMPVLLDALDAPLSRAFEALWSDLVPIARAQRVRLGVA